MNVSDGQRQKVTRLDDEIPDIPVFQPGNTPIVEEKILQEPGKLLFISNHNSIQPEPSPLIKQIRSTNYHRRSHDELFNDRIPKSDNPIVFQPTRISEKTSSQISEQPKSIDSDSSKSANVFQHSIKSDNFVERKAPISPKIDRPIAILSNEKIDWGVAVETDPRKTWSVSAIQEVKTPKRKFTIEQQSPVFHASPITEKPDHNYSNIKDSDDISNNNSSDILDTVPFSNNKYIDIEDFSNNNSSYEESLTTEFHLDDTFDDQKVPLPDVDVTFSDHDIFSLPSPDDTFQSPKPSTFSVDQGTSPFVPPTAEVIKDSIPVVTSPPKLTEKLDDEDDGLSQKVTSPIKSISRLRSDIAINLPKETITPNEPLPELPMDDIDFGLSYSPPSPPPETPKKRSVHKKPADLTPPSVDDLDLPIAKRRDQRRRVKPLRHYLGERIAPDGSVITVEEISPEDNTTRFKTKTQAKEKKQIIVVNEGPSEEIEFQHFKVAKDLDRLNDVTLLAGQTYSLHGGDKGKIINVYEGGLKMIAKSKSWNIKERGTAQIPPRSVATLKNNGKNDAKFFEWSPK